MGKFVVVTAATLILFSSFAYVVGEEILNNQHKSKVVIYEVSKHSNEKWEKDYKALRESDNMEEGLVYELEASMNDNQLFTTFQEEKDIESLLASIKKKMLNIRLLPEEEDKGKLLLEILTSTNELVKRMNDKLETRVKNGIDIVASTEGIAKLQTDFARVIPKTKGIIDTRAYLDFSRELSSEIERTIALKMISIANQNYIEAQRLRSEAEKNYFQARGFGDEEFIFSSRQKLLRAMEHETRMKEIQTEFQLY